MKRSAFILLLSPLWCGAGTVIQDTIYTGFPPQVFQGRVTISGPPMTTQDGRMISRWSRDFLINDGRIEVELEPNDTSTPAGASYYVVYRPKSGVAWSEYWMVPTSATPLTIAQVRVTQPPNPQMVVQLSQIASGGAETGQCIQWDGARWAPGECGAEAPVTSVFGRTGAVTAVAGDYDIAEISGLADLSVVTTKAEPALNAESNLGSLANNSLVAVSVTNNVATPRAGTFGDVVAMWSNCQGYLRSDGTCDMPTAPMITSTNRGMFFPWGYPWTAGLEADNLGAANRVVYWEFAVPAQITVRTLYATASNSAGCIGKKVAWGIWNSSGLLLANSSTYTITTAGETYSVTFGSDVILAPGIYYLGYTGNSSGACTSLLGNGWEPIHSTLWTIEQQRGAAGRHLYFYDSSLSSGDPLIMFQNMGPLNSRISKATGPYIYLVPQVVALPD